MLGRSRFLGHRRGPPSRRANQAVGAETPRVVVLHYLRQGVVRDPLGHLCLESLPAECRAGCVSSLRYPLPCVSALAHPRRKLGPNRPCGKGARPTRRRVRRRTRIPCYEVHFHNPPSARIGICPHDWSVIEQLHLPRVANCQIDIPPFKRIG